jgi:hypothetical protein
MGPARKLPAPIEPAHDCPCVQKHCPVRGNCVICVRNHRLHRRHIPECLQPALRDLVAELAGKLELGVVEARPSPKYWKSRQGAKLLKKLHRDVGRQP